jgi:molecular chaperone GrpE
MSDSDSPDPVVDLDDLKEPASQPDAGTEPSADAAKPDDPAPAKPDDAEELKRRIAALNDTYMRLMAEFDNYKRRTSREYQQLVDMANEKLLLDLTAVRDNFERALKAKEAAVDVDKLHKGMELTFAKFEDVLRSSGLEPYGESGDAFDPQLHDALMNSPHATVPADHIVEVFERGYRLKGKVIKHAKVIVSSGVAAPSGTDDTFMLDE